MTKYDERLIEGAWNTYAAANARLIAAAPKLLEALRKLTHQIEISNAIDDTGHALANLKALIDARAAIAAAAGETP